MKLLQGFALTAALCVISANPGFAATFTVTNTLDSGAGSLRDAIALANSTADDDIIDFLLAPGPQTINIYSDLFITSNLNIDGLGADLLTVRTNDPGTKILFIGSSANVGISGLTISGGRFGILNYGKATVSNSTISGNRYDGILNVGTATVSNSTISDNSYGILNYGTATVSNSTLSGNGLGIINGGTATLNNSTLSGNGSGIINGGTATVSNSTLSGNGFGILNEDGTTNIGNTIIAQNARDVYNQATINDNGYNLIGNGDGTIFQNGVNGNIVGTAATPVDAKLGPLADNGGPTLTHALLAGSPAIDAGNPNSLLTTDQRGKTRPQGGRIDIGAFELAQATPPQSVPEPSAIWGLAALGLFGFLHKKGRLCR